MWNIGEQAFRYERGVCIPAGKKQQQLICRFSFFAFTVCTVNKKLQGLQVASTTDS